MGKILKKILKSTVIVMALVGIVLATGTKVKAASEPNYIFLDRTGKPIGEGNSAGSGTKWATGKSYSDVAIILQKDIGCYVVSDVVYKEGVADIVAVTLPYPTEGSQNFDGLYGLAIEAIGEKAFAVDAKAGETENKLQTIILPKTIGKINNYAFQGCTALRSVTIDTTNTSANRLNSYGKNIFDGCTSLKKFYFPYFANGTVTFDNAGTFTNSYIEEVEFADKFTSIPQRALINAKMLKKVTYPDTVTKIGASAFENCESLENFEFKESITVIESSAFKKCILLKNVVLPSGLTELWGGAFSATAITTIDIPSSLVKCTSPGPFSEISGVESKLKSASFQGERTTIPENIFSGAKALTSVTYPSTVTEIGNSAFANTTSLSAVNYLENVTIFGNSVFQNSGLNMDLNLTSATKIGANAFAGCKNVSKITFGEELVELGSTIISGTAVGKVELPVSLQKASTPFKGAAYLKEASFLGTTIPSTLFSECTALETINLSKNITEIGASAFQNCAMYAENDSFANVEKIGSKAFFGCTSMKNAINISNVKEFGSSCFEQLSQLPFTGKFGAVTKIDAKAFFYCNRMDIPVVLRDTEKVTIGNEAFIGTNVKKVDLLNCDSIGNQAFLGCPLTSIKLEGKCKTIGDSVFSGCSDVTEFSIDNSEITKIGNWAFYNLSSVNELALPETLQNIGAGSFGGWSISSVVIPAKINTVWVAKNETTSLFHGPFTICKNLKKIEFEYGCTSLPHGLLYHFGNAEDLEVTIVIPSTVTEIQEPPTNKPYPTFGSNIVKKVNIIVNDNPNAQELINKIESQFRDANADVEFDVTINETTMVQNFVKRLYALTLGREADSNGLNSWVSALVAHESSGVDIGFGFVNSEECKGMGLSDEDYIKMLYRTFMDREADAGGLEAWGSQLEAGVTREKVFEGFVMSDEFRGICEQYGILVGDPESVDAFAEVLKLYRNQNADITKFVARCYTMALGRGFDEEGLEAWCEALITGENSPREVAGNGFFFSGEFLDKNLDNTEYVKVLYRTFFGREADPVGLEGWVNTLVTGEQDRETILAGFTESEEFKEILESFGLN